MAWLFELAVFAPIPEGSVNPWASQIVNGVIYLALAAGCFVWGQVRYGTTPGKRLVRVYVVGFKDGAPLTMRQAWLRFGGYLVSYLPLGCGYLMAAFQPEKRALHDLIAGTASVIKER